MKFKRIGIYSGSSAGNNEKYKKHAEALASFFVNNNITMVNGGGRVGIMGIMADKMIEEGGNCEGVIPVALKEKELAHYGMNELISSIDMHSRKRYIIDTCDAFLAFPGGYGTLDELFECLTWRQLEIHDKPVGLLNVDGYFDPIIEMVAKMKAEGFMNESSVRLLHADSSIEGLMGKMQMEVEMEADKWS